MKISEFIDRLEELKRVAGEDIEVTVPEPDNEDRYETAAVELQHVVPHTVREGLWQGLEADNTHQIVVVW